MSPQQEIISPACQKSLFSIPMGEDVMNVELTLPGGETGVVIFPEEARSGRDAYHQAMANVLHKHGLATLRPTDFLPDKTAANPEKPFRRLERLLLWAQQQPETASLPLGCLAAGDSAGTALLAAAHHADIIKAVVIRGGAADPAPDALPPLKAPVLLIGAGRDPASLRQSRHLFAKLNGASSFNIIPHATASFQEPGVMEESAQLAALWFLQHLNPSP